MKFMPRIFRAAPTETGGGMPGGTVVADGFVRPLNRKEAIASGEDIAPVTREEYYLKGLAEGQGGGGLEYIIPEQTVTFTNHQALLQNINISGMAEGDNVIIKTIVKSLSGYDIGIYSAEDEEITFASTDDVIHTNTGIWEIPDVPDNEQFTISAIRGF